MLGCQGDTEEATLASWSPHGFWVHCRHSGVQSTGCTRTYRTGSAQAPGKGRGSSWSLRTLMAHFSMSDVSPPAPSQLGRSSNTRPLSSPLLSLGPYLPELPESEVGPTCLMSVGNEAGTEQVGIQGWQCLHHSASHLLSLPGD